MSFILGDNAAGSPNQSLHPTFAAGASSNAAELHSFGRIMKLSFLLVLIFVGVAGADNIESTTISTWKALNGLPSPMASWLKRTLSLATKSDFDEILKKLSASSQIRCWKNPAPQFISVCTIQATPDELPLSEHSAVLRGTDISIGRNILGGGGDYIINNLSIGEGGKLQVLVTCASQECMRTLEWEHDGFRSVGN